MPGGPRARRPPRGPSTKAERVVRNTASIPVAIPREEHIVATTDSRIDRETVLRDLVAILQDMTGDWDVDFEGDITPATRIVADLAFESIDVVQLIVALEERYQRKDLPFEELLMRDGRYVDDLTVGDAVEFLCRHMNLA